MIALQALRLPPGNVRRIGLPATAGWAGAASVVFLGDGAGAIVADAYADGIVGSPERIGVGARGPDALGPSSVSAATSAPAAPGAPPAPPPAVGPGAGGGWGDGDRVEVRWLGVRPSQVPPGAAGRCRPAADAAAGEAADAAERRAARGRAVARGLGARLRAAGLSGWGSALDGLDGDGRAPKASAAAGPHAGPGGPAWGIPDLPLASAGAGRCEIEALAPQGDAPAPGGLSGGPSAPLSLAAAVLALLARRDAPPREGGALRAAAAARGERWAPGW